MPARAFVALFGRIGLLSFGGPAAQIALMQSEIVERHRLMPQDAFLRALSFCMLLPGPEAMQLATYAGWRLRGVRGGIVAGTLFVVPGAVVIAALAALYLVYGEVALVRAALLGVQAAVIAIVVKALLTLRTRALNGPRDIAIAVVAFAGIFAFQVPFPLIIAAAAAAGLVLGDRPEAQPVTRPAPPLSRLLGTVALWSAVWAAPLVALWILDADFLLTLGLFFSKLAIVTFGGAYAVLAYMAQAVVETFGWIDTAQMIDALGLAETTPGPLILVTEFVAILAGHGAGGWPMAALAGALCLWVTFVPCFLWIFAGAPYIEHLSALPRLAAALSGVTAAVVGVIANLALWFALHVVFTEVGRAGFGPVHLPWPELGTLRPVAVLLVILSTRLLLWRGWPLWAVLLLAAGSGGSLGWLGAA
ncbi:chromate transporter [Pseudaestuariivita atlantica]|uniref:Chromate transporter n=2 Tax=Pseudaestuariivita atlantica TaxID=1317121 RepID=A0A0L1JUL3_9RHOB|nr:chromate transporter [Pseudaestuariivita atlantica]